jgi:DNA mismatch endonuclease (patch repair protein)
MPKTRVEFWSNKFERNVARDQKVRSELEEKGWKVLWVWECETHKRDLLDRRLRELLSAAELRQ